MPAGKLKRRPTRYGMSHLLWCLVAAYDKGKAWRIQTCRVGRKYTDTNWGLNVTLVDSASSDQAGNVLEFVAKALSERGWRWESSRTCMRYDVGARVCRIFAHTGARPERCCFTVSVQSR